MSYDFATQFGNNTYFVPCGITFLGEVKSCVAKGILDVTNLGQKADSNHAPSSRHSAHWANGKYWIAAADFGGRDYAKLAYFWQYMYKKKDARLYPYAFAQRGDGYGLEWFTGDWEWTGKDQGHAHLDFAMSNANPQSSGWWVNALNDTSPWGLESWLRGGSTPTPEEDMTPEQATQLKFVFDRLNAVTPNGTYKARVNGKWQTVKRGTPGATPITLLDEMDGNTLYEQNGAALNLLDTITDRLTAIEKKLGL